MTAQPAESAAWTLLAVLAPATEFLAAAGVENARFDAECLLGQVLGLSRLELYLQYERLLTDEERARFRKLLKRRQRREPLQLILGDVEFLGRDFAMRPGVFIPRPETELFVERLLARMDGATRILELGTGTGVIALSLAAEHPDARLWVSDVSAAALDLAADNADMLGVGEQVDYEERAGLPEGDGEPVHLIVSNPPYVREDERDALAPEVIDHDPHAALFAGEDGLDVYRLLANEAPARLAPGGLLAVEIGADQAESVRALFAAAGLDPIEVLQDYAERDRFVFASNPA